MLGCPQCRDWPRPGPPAGAPFRMEGDAARLVRALKFGGWFALARPMGRAMAVEARRLAGPEGRRALLVPVPASRARRRERGFNQAGLLARSLSRALGWPRESLLTRRGGRRQARLGRHERAANVEGRFLLREGAPRPAERSALLVDDVVTTGATAGACAAALRGGGTRVLGTVAFARALHALGDGP